VAAHTAAQEVVAQHLLGSEHSSSACGSLAPAGHGKQAGGAAAAAGAATAACHGAREQAGGAGADAKLADRVAAESRAEVAAALQYANKVCSQAAVRGAGDCQLGAMRAQAAAPVTCVLAASHSLRGATPARMQVLLPLYPRLGGLLVSRNVAIGVLQHQTEFLEHVEAAGVHATGVVVVCRMLQGDHAALAL
jgi:hypothetical protein